MNKHQESLTSSYLKKWQDIISGHVSGTIMIVSSSEQERGNLSSLLGNMGYAVVACRNSLDCINSIKTSAADLIIFSINNPGDSGFNVVKNLKDNGALAGAPVMIITDSQKEDTLIKALENGADDFLSKPIREGELFARARRLIKRKKDTDMSAYSQKLLENTVIERTEQLLRTMDELKSATLETIYRLSNAAEMKDKATGMHINRVSIYSMSMASRLGYSTAVSEAIM